MAYESVDKLQNILGEQIFHYKNYLYLPLMNEFKTNIVI